MATSYSNLGGTGIRNPAITVTPSAGLVASGVSTAILDGTQADSYWWNSGQTTATLTFDFGSGQSVVIDEFKWYQDSAHSQGTWKWAGSNDNSTFTDLLTGINLGNGAATNTYSYTNTTAYRYYKLIQTGGSTSSSPYIREIEFKISGFRMLYLDEGGHATGGSNGGSTTVVATLTTTRSDDIVIAIVAAERTSGSFPQVTSISDTAGLTWTLRKRLTFTGGRHTNPQAVELWWAYAPSPLTADVITANFVANDNTIITTFAIAGANTSAPWDTNGSLPATNTDVTGSSTDPSVSGVSTTASNIMALAMWGSGNNSNPIGTAPSGFTEIAHVNATSGTDWEYGSSAYGVFTSALSSATVTFGELELDWGMIVDAIVVAPFTNTGTWASTEADDTMAFAGGVLGGSWSSTEATDVMAFAALLKGTWGSTEAKDTLAFVGHPSLFGSWNSTEAKDTMAATAIGPIATYFDPTTASHGVDFQNLNMTVVNQEGFGEPVGARSNTSYTTGKLYVEFFTQLGNNASGVGIGNSATTFANFGTALGVVPGYATGGAGIFQAQDGTIWINGVEQTNWSGVSLYRANIGVAIDLVNELIWFRVNGGHWNGIAGANPANGVASPRPPANGPQAGSGGYDISSLTGGAIYLIAEIVGAYDKVAMNAGASAFSYGAPVGFSAWDSAAQATPALQMDGYATSGISEVASAYNPIMTGTVTLSTTQNNDVIVLGIATGGFYNAARVESITSTSGLVWKRRNRRWQVGGYKGDGSTIINTGLDTEIWWAHAPTALSGEVITVNMDPTTYPGAGFVTTSGTGSMSLIAFGVSGANYTTPWDAHTQAGGFVDNIGNIFYTPATAELSTKANKTFLIGFHGDTLADTGITQDPWTYVTSVTASEHLGYPSFLSLVYQIVEEPQFNTNVVYGQTYAGYPVFQAQSMMFDSIVAAGESGTSAEVVWFWDAGCTSNIQQLSTGTTLQLSYSATNFNLMVLIEVVIMSASGNGEVTSISEGQGSLSSTGFERRSRTVTNTPKGSLAVEIWWGWMPMYTSAERANNDTITINTINAASGDIVGAIMFGLGGTTGAFGLGDPFWDVNPSVPAANNSTVSAPPYATDISTTIPSDLLVAWTANNTENVPGFTDPFITLVQAYPATILPIMQLNSLAPPLYTGFEFFYEPGLATSETAEFLAGSPEPVGWIVVADAIPVGPPQPPTGVWASTDTPDKFTHSGNYTAIGIASPGGWVGYPAAHGVIAATEHEDICGGTPNLGYAPFLGEGWLGGVAAHATWHSTEGDDQMALYGWVLGFGITGQLNAPESKDRMSSSNRTTVTGTMGSVETKDRWASAGLVLPPGRIHPTTPYKRRLLIIT